MLIGTVVFHIVDGQSPLRMKRHEPRMNHLPMCAGWTVVHSYNHD